MGRPRIFAILTAALHFFSWPSEAQDLSRWTKADEEVVRLPPSALTFLGAPLVAELERRGCTIPQIWSGFGNGVSNVISGEFERRGQIDIALLCSVDRRSVMLVFWGGSTERVEEVKQTWSPDLRWLQVVALNEIGYSRAIRPVSEAYILNRYSWYGGPEPPRIDHQGISMDFAEKFSVVLYRHQGEWLHLQGAAD